MRATIILVCLSIALGCGKREPVQPAATKNEAPELEPKVDPTKHKRFLWEFETGDKVASSPAIGSDGTVYVGSWDKKLYALSGKRGAKLWEFETGGGYVCSPSIGSDGTLYVGSHDNKLYAIKTESQGLAKSPWPMRGQNPQHTGRAPVKPLNVLFISIDDLRPALGCYGDKTALTPNIDQLAKRSILFNRAYCQQAVCCPSRLSLLTGLRPDTIKVWDLATHFREAKPQAITLPQHFKNHGYHTRSIGKIFHGGGKPSKDPPSWSAPPLHDFVREPTVRYATQKNLKGKGLKRASTESAKVPDNRYIDGMVCEDALRVLDQYGKEQNPFFLAVGFRKPHLPFCAPQKYWDLYKDIPPPASQKHPKDAPELAIRSWGELEGYTDIPKNGKLTAVQVQKLRHGYYACVSYVDALTGRLLKKLDELKLTQNTVVLLWGDHGFHLGEQGLWTKANNYELSTRVPLILSVPNLTTQGIQTDALVEFVDVYPTLAKICGLKEPNGVEGISLMPLIKNPKRPWKKAAFSQYPRSTSGNRHRKQGDFMGYAIRTDRYRYIEWRNVKTQSVQARELYDHKVDPHEMKNLAELANQPTKLKELQLLLKGGWQKALPANH